MPLPLPNEEENKNKFIERCMSDATMQQEYPNNLQRLAICTNLWNHK